MRNIFSKACYAILTTLATLPALTWSVTVPNADTPLFYLVSSSTSSSNILPLRMDPQFTGPASLIGNGPLAKFYFYQGQLTIHDPNDENNSYPYKPLINSFQSSPARCDDFGGLVFIPKGSGSSNKCARYTSFQIRSNQENSQLGAELVFNYVGLFYSCSEGQEVHYKIDPSDGPSGCQPINLWTLPVAG